jgi:3-oxoadipate enol-lactonase
MPFAHAADGTRLHYRAWGPADAEPVLLIQGLGADKAGWIAQRRALGSRYRCIALDNRGVGRSDAPEGPYDLEVMAADAVAVLDAEDVTSTHVVGASMGGVLAQILAVRHPGRVRSLVLACTACQHLPWRRRLLADWADVARRDGMTAFLRANLRWLVGARSLRRFALPFHLAGPVALRCPPHAFAAQIDAILAMDDALADELGGIDVPALVIVGSQDVLTPRGDSEELVERIPGAELAIVWGGAHGFMVEQLRTFNREVLAFLDRVSVSADVVPLRAAAISEAQPAETSADPSA